MFGPILHVATFEADKIDSVIAEINAKQYGLTFGLHTRIEARVKHLVESIHAGNIYVNRNQIGAVVGSQPFGGEGLSGTGPKAGGPQYLRRFRKGLTTAVNAAESPVVSASTLAEHMPDATLGGWSTRPDRLAVLRKHLRGKGAEAITAAAAVIALTTITIQPAAAGHRRGNDAAALLAFAAIFGTIATIIATEQYRDSYSYSHGPVYRGPVDVPPGHEYWRYHRHPHWYQR